MIESKGYTTANEKRYLDELASGKYTLTNPNKLLRNYIKSAKNRIKWGTFNDGVLMNVDGKECIRYARELII